MNRFRLIPFLLLAGLYKEIRVNFQQKSYAKGSCLGICFNRLDARIRNNKSLHRAIKLCLVSLVLPMLIINRAILSMAIAVRSRSLIKS